jgi:hypothetical protein
MVEDIIDPVVREIVKKRLEENGIDLNGKDRKPPKEVWKEPLYMRTTKSNKRVPIKKVRVYNVAENMIPMMDEQGQPYRYVEPGSNHHIEIFEYIDKKGKVKKDGKVITMFEAVQRNRREEPVVKKDYGDNQKFVCSLAINEMFMLELDGGAKELYRVQKISQNTQIFFQPHIFGGDLKNHSPVSKIPNQLKGYKVTIDPLGRTYPAND